MQYYNEIFEKHIELAIKHHINYTEEPFKHYSFPIFPDKRCQKGAYIYKQTG